MPIYEYLCTDCGTRFDMLRSMRDADQPVPCKNCESGHTARVLSVFYAQSGGRVVAGASNTSGCVGCSGGSCSSCGH